MLTLKPSVSRPASKTESISTITAHTKTKPIDHHNIKQINFGSHTVNCDPPHKKKSPSTPTLNPSKVRSLTQKIKLISTALPKLSAIDPHPKIKSFSMPPYKTKLISIHILNEVFFNPHAKTWLIPIPIL